MYIVSESYILEKFTQHRTTRFSHVIEVDPSKGKRCAPCCCAACRIVANNAYLVVWMAGRRKLKRSWCFAFLRMKVVRRETKIVLCVATDDCERPQLDSKKDNCYE